MRAYSAAVGQSAVVRLRFSDDELSGLDLYPALPVHDSRRHLRNLPTLAVGGDAQRVIERFTTASAPFGTKIECRDGIGQVVLT